MQDATGDHQGWRFEAACRDIHPDLFFPVGMTGVAVTEIERAKAVCACCPVVAACLDFAVRTNQEYGIWGGTDEEERRVLRRRRRAAERLVAAS
ncbi:MAG: WhiB family transcriptional regulator [Acidimicrobiales bacterium]